jgi:hypothetical protein
MKKTNLFSRSALLTLSVAVLSMGCSKQQRQQEAAVNGQQASAAAPTARVITATGGSFSVLTYNIADLPQALSSAPTPRDSSTAQIGRLINAYDVVHVQEDFNYHAYLYDYGNVHPYRTATSGGAGIGDGLNSLSYFPISDFSRTTWNTRINENALTPKGFTFCRLQIATGVYIDFYNLHTNACGGGNGRYEWPLYKG